MKSANSTKGFEHARRGQTMLEYVLIAAAIAVSVCAAFKSFGGAVENLVQRLTALV